MLTEQHKYATRLMGRQLKSEYQSHLCGVCHAIGSRYGLAPRVLTGFELVLLSLLADAQSAQASPKVVKACPLNVLQKTACIQSEGADFAASVGILLATLKMRDDLDDGAGLRLLTKVGEALLRRSYRLALDQVAPYGITCGDLDGFAAQQRDCEATRPLEAHLPTAELAQKLFQVTARISNASANEQALGELGHLYGEYIYWMDALRDFPKDMIQSQFNPLQGFASQHGVTFSLRQEGVRWMAGNLVRVRQGIEGVLSQAALHRAQSVLMSLLTGPLDQTIQSLEKKLEENQAFVFMRFTRLDLVKAGLLILPAIAAGQAASAGELGAEVANQCAKGSELIQNLAAPNPGAAFHQLGFSLGSMDWLLDVVKQQNDPGPCTDACNVACTPAVEGCCYFSPAGCIDGSSDTCWNSDCMRMSCQIQDELC